MEETTESKSKKETHELEIISQTEAELKQLAKDADSQIVTATTIKESRNLLSKIRQARYGIQRIEKSNNDKLNVLKKKNKQKAEDHIKIILKSEESLEAKVMAIEKAEKDKADALIKAEDDRKKAHRDNIAIIEAFVTEIRICTDIGRLNDIKEEITLNLDGFEEFNEEGNLAIATVTTAIDNRIFIIEEESKVQAIKSEFNTFNKELLNERIDEIESSRQEAIKEAANKMDEETILPDERYDDDSTDNWIKGPSQLMKETDELGMMNSPKETPPYKESLSFSARLPETITDIKIPPVPLNIYSMGEYTFGMSKNVPFSKVKEIRTAIEKILSEKSQL